MDAKELKELELVELQVAATLAAAIMAEKGWPSTTHAGPVEQKAVELWADLVERIRERRHEGERRRQPTTQQPAAKKRRVLSEGVRRTIDD